MKERKYNLDLMRVILSLCVITVHSFHYFGVEDDFMNTVLRVPLMACDGLFYMVSGYFNLEKQFNNSSDIKNYYKSRFINVLFPFLAFVLVWTVWDYLHVVGSFNLLEILDTFFKGILYKSAEGHMWFMYPLFGLLLSTPFLSKMLHSMDEKELKILWYIALCFNVISYYLCWNQGHDFAVLCWVMEGWIIYYFAGYYYRHVIAKESGIKWLLLAIVGYIFTIMGLNGVFPFFKAFEGATNIQPMFTLFCVGCFMFWDKVVKIKNDSTVGRIISFLSINTYMIYLFHTRGIEYVVRKLSITEANLPSGLLVIVGTYFISLLLAFVANQCLKPIQKLINRFLVFE